MRVSSGALARSSVAFALALPLWAVAPGCGTSLPGPSDSTADAGPPEAMPDLAQPPQPDASDNGAPSTTYPAPFPDPPQVITSGGPVLTQPRIVPLFFQNDDTALVAQMADFDAKVGATTYWKTAVSEYKVGAAAATPPVTVAESPSGTIDDSAIQQWLGAKLNGNDPTIPAPDRNTVYSIHYPAGVSITLAGGGRGGTSKSCTDFGGYHSDFTLDANHMHEKVAYAVLPRCPDFGGLTGIDAVTATESHELIEASTDPYPQTSPGYSQLDNGHLYWLRVLGGGEVGDMCAQDPSSFTKFPELPYTVQRTWSNVAATAGHDPCVPAPATPYFNAVPVLDDDVSIYNGQADASGVLIAVGDTKTIDLDLFSDAATSGPFTVEAKDISALFGGGGTATLRTALDRTSGVNGEKLHLSITVLAAGRNGTETFYVKSKQGGATHYWFGLVGQPPQ